MVVAGASRHAKEILEILYQQNRLEDLCFFDDYNPNVADLFYSRFRVVKSLAALSTLFSNENKFILGLGGVRNRYLVAQKLEDIGGSLESIVAESAKIGHFDVTFEKGLNIMDFACINNSVKVGEGTLVNAFVSIHHDVSIGRYCELSPRATLLGGAKLGDFCSIGSGATILPNVVLGRNVVVGAGAVVTKNTPDNSLVVGVPGKLTKKLAPLEL